MGIDQVGSGNGRIIPIEWLRIRSQLAAAKPGNAAEADSNTIGPDDDRVAADASGGVNGSQQGPGSEDSPAARPDPAELLARYQTETSDLPDVRADKVIEAKLKISSGYYNSDAVRRQVILSVLKDLLPASPQASTSGDAAKSDEELR